jgi:hypothetical protein
MIRLSRSLFTAGLLLVLLAPVNHARADDGCNSAGSGCGGCGGCGAGGLLSRLCQRFEPSVTYYAPVPYWWPNYFGPPHTSYQLVQYWTPPDVSAQNVKARILAINSANPALLPPPKEPLPFPKSDKKPPVEKLP